MTEYIPTPRAINTLVVIEAPGKIAALTFALRKAGMTDFHIQATSGHLLDMPDMLMPSGIDRNLVETGRFIRNVPMAEAVMGWAAKSQRVLIACDADQEGDVLAWDIAQLIPKHQNVQRVRLRALDFDSVVDTFSHPEPVNLKDSWPGATRRILDRLIGCSFSRFNLEQDSDVSVGRIQSGLLGAVSQERIPFAEAIIALPCCDGKDPFVAVLPVYEDNEDAVRELVHLGEQFAKEGHCVPLGEIVEAPDFQPWNYGEAVLAVAEATDRSILEVSHSMQRLYENGKMSYPRSASPAMTGDGLSCVDNIADHHGVRFDAARPPKFSRNSRHAHEAPRPLRADVDISSPLLIMSPDQAALSLIARHLLACGQPHALHRPDPASLPSWAAGLSFERKVCLWLRPWPRRKAVTGFRTRPREEAMMRLLLKHNLGRASTQVLHAIKFAGRDLLDEKMRMTDKARAWIELTPAVLLDPTTSASIEALIDGAADRHEHNESPPQAVKNILDYFGLWEAMETVLEHTAMSIQSGLSQSISRQDDHKKP